MRNLNPLDAACPRAGREKFPNMSTARWALSAPHDHPSRERRKQSQKRNHSSGMGFFEGRARSLPRQTEALVAEPGADKESVDDNAVEWRPCSVCPSPARQSVCPWAASEGLPGRTWCGKWANRTEQLPPRRSQAGIRHLMSYPYFSTTLAKTPASTSGHSRQIALTRPPHPCSLLEAHPQNIETQSMGSAASRKPGNSRK